MLQFYERCSDQRLRHEKRHGERCPATRRVTAWKRAHCPNQQRKDQQSIGATHQTVRKLDDGFRGW
jgi:hypothetical protein